ncbi:DMT family transporter [Patescibacteria group bacterium]|nr:DMT family transporter [Patescibacteria group bacterium]
MSLRTKALLAVFAAALLWSGANSVGKILVTHTNPFVIAFYRFTLASLIILPWFWKAKKPKNFAFRLLPLGIFNGGNILFFYSGLARTTANTSSILGATVPIVTLLLSALIIHETITGKRILGVLIGLLGALFIIILPELKHGAPIYGNFSGNILLLGSILSWTLYIISSRKILSKDTFDPVLALAMNFFVTSAMTGLAALLTHQSFLVPAFSDGNYIVVFLYAVLGITITTFFLFQWAVQYLSATTVSLKEYLQLVIGIGLNILILGERMTVEYVLGSILVVIGLIVATGLYTPHETLRKTMGRQ